MKDKINIAWSEPVGPNKIGISRGPFVLGVASEHTLDADAHTFDVLNRGPALTTQKIQADDAVGVNVRVHGNGTVVRLDEDDFWCFCDAVYQHGPKRGYRVCFPFSGALPIG